MVVKFQILTLSIPEDIKFRELEGVFEIIQIM